MGDEARQPYGVDADAAGGDSAASARQHCLLGGVAQQRPRAGGVSGRLDDAGRPQRRARRGIPLVLVMKLDDLDTAEMRGAELRTAHHQGGPEREVRRHERVRRRAWPEPPSETLQVLLAESGRTLHSVHGVLRTPAKVLASGGHHAEVDGDIGAGTPEGVGVSSELEIGHVGSGPAEHLGQRASGPGRVDGGNELEIGRREDRLADGRPHPPRCAEDPDPDHAPTVAVGGGILRRTKRSRLRRRGRRRPAPACRRGRGRPPRPRRRA